MTTLRAMVAARVSRSSGSLDSPGRSTRDGLIDTGLEYGILVALIALSAYFAFASPYFLTTQNLLNIGLAVSITGILAASLTIALIAGQLDLTVGVQMGLATTIVAAALAERGQPVWIAILAALGACLAVGVVNGILVVDLGINSIIATIAMGIAVVGISASIPSPKGQSIYITNDKTIQDFMLQKVLGVPVPTVVMLAVYVIAYVMLTHTRLGWHIYATGGNPSAALRAGIRVGAIYRFVFLASASLSLLAGIILLGRSGAGGPGLGTDRNTFDALTAVLLGGIGLSGGAGRIERTLVGVLVVGVLENGMTLSQVDAFLQNLVRGTILVLAVVLGAIGAKRRAR